MTTSGQSAFPTSVCGAAELYLRDWSAYPIPVPYRSKKPSRKAWQDLRLGTTELAAAFPEDTPMNLGLLLGEPSNGLLDADLDVTEAIAAAPALLPPTGWISGRKSKPRSHYWYRSPNPPGKADDKFNDIDAQATCLVELRSTGAQTIVPPSCHESGEAIEWHSFTQPAEVSAEQLLRAVQELSACVLLARHWPDKGNRHSAYLALTGGLLRGGMSIDRTGAFVAGLVAATRDDEFHDRARTIPGTAARLEKQEHVQGWPKLSKLIGEDVVTKVRQWLGMSIPATAKGKRLIYRPLPPFEPFPLASLPPVVRDWTETASASIGCDPALVALPALAVVAGCIGNSRAIRLKRRWVEPSVLWSVTVGYSGEHKSPGFSAAVDALLDLQMDAFDQYKLDLEQHKADVTAWQEQDRDERGPKPEPPAEPIRYVVEDITIEALGEILEDNPHGVLAAHDELDAWFQSFTRYGSGKKTDRPHWLKLHNAGTLLVNRLTRDRKTLAVRRAAVSLTGGIQPGILAHALDMQALQSGLGARFLFAMPPRRKRVWTDDEPDEEMQERYTQLLRELLALELADKGKRRPHLLPLSSPAKEVWLDFYKGWAEEQFNAEGAQAAAYAKLERYAPRLTLQHHVVSHVAAGDSDLSPITETSMVAGVLQTRWFAREAERIYAMLAESHEVQETRKLVEWIQERGNKTTVRDLQKSNNRKWTSADQAEEALHELVQSGLGRWEKEPARHGGGQSRKWFVLAENLHDTSDTCSDDDAEGDHPLHDTCSWRTTDDGCGGENPFDATIIQQESYHSSAGMGDDQVSEVSCRYSAGGTEPSPEKVERTVEGVSRASVVQRYRVASAAELLPVLAAVADSGLVGLDTETTGLNPRTDRVRLLTLLVDTLGGSAVYLIDCFAVDPTPLWETLADVPLIIHNAAFDLAFLAALGFTPQADVHDTMLYAQLLVAGTRQRVSLAACCQRWLGRTLAKDLQRSHWGGSLTNEQLDYAATDVAVLRPLYDRLVQEIGIARLARAAEIERRCLPAWVWMSQAGMPLDRASWLPLADESHATRERLGQEVFDLAPARDGCFPGVTTWDFGSNAQIKEALGQLGFPVEDTEDGTLAGIDHPFAARLRDLRFAKWLDSSYGQTFLRHVAVDGRIYAGWQQLGNIAGRSSCREPNLQQIPRDPRYRRCFVALEGCVLIKADYAAVHLRIAAKIASEQKMIDAFRAGQDLHRLTAQALLGKEDISKQDRQLAKAVAFGLLYGMGAKGLRSYAKQSYGVEMTLQEASKHKSTFFVTYPGLARWHRSTAAGKARQTETRTLSERRRLVDPQTPLMHRLNSPVLGTEADAAKIALGLLWQRRGQCAGARPIALIHDEIVVEAPDVSITHKYTLFWMAILFLRPPDP